MAALDPFICFTAGTLVHKASGKEVIEGLRVGQRTLTEATKDAADLPGDDPTEVDPRTWRLVRLQTAKPAGSDNLVDVELLRPLAWIEQTARWSARESVRACRVGHRRPGLRARDRALSGDRGWAWAGDHRHVYHRPLLRCWNSPVQR